MGSLKNGEIKKQAALEANHNGEQYRQLKKHMIDKIKAIMFEPY